MKMMVDALKLMQGELEKLKQSSKAGQPRNRNICSPCASVIVLFVAMFCGMKLMIQ
jgi:hypothetical protein